MIASDPTTKWLDGKNLGDDDLVLVVNSVYKGGQDFNVRPIISRTSHPPKGKSSLKLKALKDGLLKFRWPRVYARADRAAGGGILECT